jgi:hypothetical protein
MRVNYGLIELFLNQFNLLLETVRPSATPNGQTVSEKTGE